MSGRVGREMGETLKRGFQNGLSITVEMVKVIIPFYLIVELIRHLGLIGFIGGLFRPFMSLFGLPGESALALIAGYTANLYGAIAVLKPLHLSSRDVTTIALMLGLAHSLPVETPITRKTGVNAWLLLAVRISLSLLAGMALNLAWKLF
jgi:spore maturation protein SpmB